MHPARPPFPPDADPGPRALAMSLRWAMHGAFVLLPVLAVTRATASDGSSVAATIGAAALILALYAAGSWRALRAARGGSEDSAEGRSRSPLALLLPSGPWVLAIALAWAAACLVSASFVWLAFPLFFLALFALRAPAGSLMLAAVAVWAILTPLLRGDQAELGVGEVLGPLVGAAFSLIAHGVYGMLEKEARRSRVLVAELQEAQAELAESERGKGVAEERERLAQDIHDTLAQGLNSIVLLSRGAQARHPEAARAFSRIEETARENLADARRLVRDLSDPPAGASLEQALRRVIRRAELLEGAPRCELRIDAAVGEVPPEQVETLELAARSLVANVLQHAQARRCVITAAWWPDRVSLDVADDGRGFDASSPPPRRAEGGDGLALLRRRVAAADGEMTIDAAPGEGTRVGIVLPGAAAGVSDAAAPREAMGPRESTGPWAPAGPRGRMGRERG
ncbi:sensor histidine kinase [Brachybacterium hainanense]|uniref:Oxygen sensor histidine kinase NreB n=1 Tax=Brachybacterium hainanense TaxID=1541174 RepID=A0ABV6RBV5_9MICO